jgi:uncharacterized protein (TIGR03437 family)
MLALCGGALLAQNPSVGIIVNNYGLINAGTVAQGAIFIVTGANLADQETTTLQEVPLQTNLKGVQIRFTVGGVQTFAPLYYAFNNQLAGILPSNTPLGNGTFVVINNGKVSAAAQVNVIRSAFGMLTLNGAGTGAAAVHDQNYVLLGPTNATNPEKAVVFYGSGVGAASGDETIVQNPTNLGDIPISITIGGRQAQVLYRGRTIYPGLDQINVIIPGLDTNAYGCNVAVVITTNGVQANAGTIPVAQSGSTCPTNPGGGGGGGNSGTAITQAEIDRWIAAGSYTTGAIGTGRSTAYSIDSGTGATTITKQDTFAAEFDRINGADYPRLLRGEIPAGYAQYLPQVGACVVYNTIPANPYPLINRASLDAGSAITANGPNGVQVAPRSNQQFSGIFYSAPNVPNTYLAAGSYTFTGPGGPDVAAFTGNLDVDQEFIVTNNPDDFKTINRTSALTVRWTGGDPSTNVQISGNSFTLSGQGVPQTPVTFLCLVNNAAGQFTVPTSVLSQLPVTPSISGPGFSILVRGSFSVSTANRGNRISISNIDYANAAQQWGWGYTPEYR